MKLTLQTGIMRRGYRDADRRLQIPWRLAAERLHRETALQTLTRVLPVSRIRRRFGSRTVKGGRIGHLYPEDAGQAPR